MRAGGIDAFAAPVGQPRDAAAPEKIEQPGREIAADHVAVAARQRPARQSAKADSALRGTEPPSAIDRFLHVEQAEVILAALADHDAAPLLVGIGYSRRSSWSICRCRLRV